MAPASNSCTGSATATIAAEGLDRVTARQIADRAGLSVGSIYTRYDSVPDLLAEVWSHHARSAFDELVTAVCSVLAGTGDAQAVAKEVEGDDGQKDQQAGIDREHRRGRLILDLDKHQMTIEPLS